MRGIPRHKRQKYAEEYRKMDEHDMSFKEYSAVRGREEGAISRQEAMNILEHAGRTDTERLQASKFVQSSGGAVIEKVGNVPITIRDKATGSYARVHPSGAMDVYDAPVRQATPKEIDVAAIERQRRAIMDAFKRPDVVVTPVNTYNSVDKKTLPSLKQSILHPFKSGRQSMEYYGEKAERWSSEREMAGYEGKAGKGIAYGTAALAVGGSVGTSRFLMDIPKTAKENVTKLIHPIKAFKERKSVMELGYSFGERARLNPDIVIGEFAVPAAIGGGISSALKSGAVVEGVTAGRSARQASKVADVLDIEMSTVDRSKSIGTFDATSGTKKILSESRTSASVKNPILGDTSIYTMDTSSNVKVMGRGKKFGGEGSFSYDFSKIADLPEPKGYVQKQAQLPMPMQPEYNIKGKGKIDLGYKTSSYDTFRTDAKTIDVANIKPESPALLEYKGKVKPSKKGSYPSIPDVSIGESKITGVTGVNEFNIKTPGDMFPSQIKGFSQDSMGRVTSTFRKLAGSSEAKGIIDLKGVVKGTELRRLGPRRLATVDTSSYGLNTKSMAPPKMLEFKGNIKTVEPFQGSYNPYKNRLEVGTKGQRIGVRIETPIAEINERRLFSFKEASVGTETGTKMSPKLAAIETRLFEKIQKGKSRARLFELEREGLSIAEGTKTGEIKEVFNVDFQKRNLFGRLPDQAKAMIKEPKTGTAKSILPDIVQKQDIIKKTSTASSDSVSPGGTLRLDLEKAAKAAKEEKGMMKVVGDVGKTTQENIMKDLIKAQEKQKTESFLKGKYKGEFIGSIKQAKIPSRTASIGFSGVSSGTAMSSFQFEPFGISDTKNTPSSKLFQGISSRISMGVGSDVFKTPRISSALDVDLGSLSSSRRLNDLADRMSESRGTVSRLSETSITDMNKVTRMMDMTKVTQKQTPSLKRDMDGSLFSSRSSLPRFTFMPPPGIIVPPPPPPPPPSFDLGQINLFGSDRGKKKGGLGGKGKYIESLDAILFGIRGKKPVKTRWSVVTRPILRRVKA